MEYDATDRSGNTGGEVAAGPPRTGTGKPSHFRPVWAHLRQCGFASSHFTRRILGGWVSVKFCRGVPGDENPRARVDRSYSHLPTSSAARLNPGSAPSRHSSGAYAVIFPKLPSRGFSRLASSSNSSRSLAGRGLVLLRVYTYLGELRKNDTAPSDPLKASHNPGAKLSSLAAYADDVRQCHLTVPTFNVGLGF